MERESCWEKGREKEMGHQNERHREVKLWRGRNVKRKEEKGMCIVWKREQDRQTEILKGRKGERDVRRGRDIEGQKKRKRRRGRKVEMTCEWMRCVPSGHYERAQQRCLFLFMALNLAGQNWSRLRLVFDLVMRLFFFNNTGKYFQCDWQRVAFWTSS